MMQRHWGRWGDGGMWRWNGVSAHRGGGRRGARLSLHEWTLILAFGDVDDLAAAVRVSRCLLDIAQDLLVIQLLPEEPVFIPRAPCGLCPAMFSHVAYLRVHIRLEHGSIVRYHRRCLYEAQHRRRHRPLPRALRLLGAVPPKYRTVYSCGSCMKG